MQEFLLALFSPWLITVSFCIILLLSVVYLPTLVISFFRMPMVAKIVLTLALLVGFYLRLVVVPQYHRIYYDEDRYLAYAVTFAKFGKATNINYAMPNRLIKGTPDLVARLTVPTINAWVFRFFGFTENHLYVTAKVFSGIQILLIFVLTVLLFKNYVAAAISSLLVALLPINVYWSTSTNIDAYFVFFSLLASITTLIYVKRPNVLNSVLLISSIILLQFVRFESLLFFLVLLSSGIIMRRWDKKPLLTKRDMSTVLLLALIVGMRIYISYSVLSKTWCCGEATPLEVFGIEYFFRNVLSNVIALFNRAEFPFVLTILAMVAIFNKKDIRIIPLLIWFICYFTLYSFYYAGLFFSYQFSGSYGRYFLMLIPPLVILASLTISDAIINYQVTLKIMIIMSIVFLVLILPTVLGYKRMISSSPWYSIVEQKPRESHVFLESEILPALNKHSILIHPLSAVVLMHNQGAIYFPTFQNDQSVIDSVFRELKKGTSVYLYSPATCYVYPDQCKRFADRIDIIPVINPKTKEPFSEFAQIKLIDQSKKLLK